MPEWAQTWHVRVPVEVADRLRERLGSDRRAAVEEVPQSDAPRPDARAFRVARDEPVVTLVAATWPVWDHLHDHERIRVQLLAVDPVPPRRDRGPGEPTPLGEVVYVLREDGWLTEDELARSPGLEERGST